MDSLLADLRQLVELLVSKPHFVSWTVFAEATPIRTPPLVEVQRALLVSSLYHGPSPAVGHLQQTRGVYSEGVTASHTNRMHILYIYTHACILYTHMHT